MYIKSILSTVAINSNSMKATILFFKKRENPHKNNPSTERPLIAHVISLMFEGLKGIPPCCIVGLSKINEKMIENISKK